MEKITLFKGSKRDFNDFLEEELVENYTPFMELIRQYNEKVRANDVSAVDELGELNRNVIENVVIYSDDFASVTDHVISNFPNIVILGHNIEKLYIQNAPKRVEYSLKVTFDDVVEEKWSDYYEASTDDIIKLYDSLDNGDVVGQKDAKKKSCVGLYKSTILKENQPLVLLYYGPSGVGKTELAKKISEFYKGTLTRIQFSMMQTEEAYKYIFGDAHGKPSFARDLLSRETNIVLIDEFDKVSPALYNVFYQMFDEGEFEDINYKVDVSNCVFILTSNFSSEKHIAETLGFPIYSRIDNKIKFDELTNAEIAMVIDKMFKDIYSKISDEDISLIEDVKLKDRYLESIDIFRNIRLLDKFIENDIFDILFDSKVNSSHD